MNGSMSRAAQFHFRRLALIVVQLTLAQDELLVNWCTPSTEDMYQSSFLGLCDDHASGKPDAVRECAVSLLSTALSNFCANPFHFTYAMPIISIDTSLDCQRLKASHLQAASAQSRSFRAAKGDHG